MNFLIYKKIKEKRSYKVRKNKLVFHAVSLTSLGATEEARKRSVLSYEARINTRNNIKEVDAFHQKDITLDTNNFHTKRIGSSAVTLIVIVIVIVIVKG